MKTDREHPSINCPRGSRVDPSLGGSWHAAKSCGRFKATRATTRPSARASVRAARSSFGRTNNEVANHAASLMANL